MKRSVIVGSAVAVVAVIAIAAIVLGAGGTKTKMSITPNFGQKTSTSPLPASSQKSAATATPTTNSSSYGSKSSPSSLTQKITTATTVQPSINANNSTATKTQNTGSSNIAVDILKNASIMKAGQKTFNPDPVRVSVGGTVTWKNSDTAVHTVTSGKGPKDTQSGKMFDSGLIKPEKTFEYKFANAGTYDYYCTVHPAMVGKIIVE